MKKVGVVTLTRGSNYGNKLQHYAVLFAIRHVGYEPVTLNDLTRRGFAEPAEVLSLKDKLKPAYFSSAVRSRLLYKYHKKNDSDRLIYCLTHKKRIDEELAELNRRRGERFDAFSERYLPYDALKLSNVIRPDEAALSGFAAFTTGSDQVFNPVYTDTSPVRFLAFAPEGKRIALSPSFGVHEIPLRRRETYKRLLNGFASLSVREQSGHKLILELTGRDAAILVDPTLVPTPDEWDAIASKPEGFTDKPYMLCYFLGKRRTAYEREIDKIAKERGLSLINLSERTEPESYCYDPAEFLWLVKHADFVATDSFHGAVFSTIYRREFLSFPRSESGFGKDDRSYTLLTTLGLTGRMFTENRAAPDWDNAARVIDAERECFLGYLKTALYKAEGYTEPVYRSVAELNAADPAHCTGCGGCTLVCPKGALSLIRDGEGFLKVALDSGLCYSCGLCVQFCKGMEKHNLAYKRQGFAAVNTDESVRLKSSSGGVFSALAEAVISDNGAVFGAAFDESFRLAHCMAVDTEGYEAFRGSKYLQSRADGAYQEVKEQLELGKAVLFSGTPCQTAALNAYLGRDYEKLLTVDLICHGTPSQRALDAYLCEFKRLGKLKTVSFRDKSRGWARFSMKLTGERASYRKDLETDPYLTAFLANLNLNESCYCCRFKTLERASDLTLADYWGFKSAGATENDDKGVSLVIAQSEKGLEALRSARGLKLTKADIDKAAAANSAFTASVTRPMDRDEFYKRLDSLGFSGTVKSLRPMTIRRRVYRAKDALWRIKRKLLG